MKRIWNERPKVPRERTWIGIAVHSAQSVYIAVVLLMLVLRWKEHPHGTSRPSRTDDTGTRTSHPSARGKRRYRGYGPSEEGGSDEIDGF